MADWQAGDLALCVRTGLIEGPTCRHFGDNPEVPRKGYLGTVAAVEVPRSRSGRPMYCGHLVLRFVDGRGAIASRFRKVTPPKPTADDREVIDLMLGKPARVGADA